MRKILLFICLITCIGNGLTAQNKNIRFEESKEWKAIVKKAKKEKKLIFIDCYTDWCGPCKMLAANVFTDDAVADFFNAQFINAKFEMEKDADGVARKEAWGIKAYPTLIFVDPKTEEVVHVLVGAGQPDWLLAGGRDALDPQNNLKGLTARYQAGERNPEFLGKYLEILGSAYRQEEQGAVASEYLVSLPVEELATKGNWELIKRNINDPLSQPLRYVMSHRKAFYELSSEEEVNQKLNRAVLGAAMELAYWVPELRTPFNEAYNSELTAYLQEIDFQGAPEALAFLLTAELGRKSDFRGMLNLMQETFRFNLFRGGLGGRYFQHFIEQIGHSSDASVVRDATAWIDRRCEATSDFFAKAGLMDSKARVLRMAGDEAGAQQAKAKEEEYTKQGEAQSGGRVQRAIRMN